MSGALRHEEAPLVDILDRLLDRGAAIEGDLVLSLADVELVWLGLRAVVGGIEHAPPGARLESTRGVGGRMAGADAGRGAVPAPRPVGAASEGRVPAGGDGAAAGATAPARAETPRPEPASVTEDGLVRLVLSLVELVRQLMERQALRRADDGSLSDEQQDRLGTALLRLDERMARLREHFGLEADDLELTVGATSAA